MSKSALVIGAGITGVSTAEWLRRAGVVVTLIDRVNPGDPEQASYGNGGLLARCAIVPVSEPGLIAKAPKMLLDPASPLFMRWSYLPRLLPWLLPFLRNSSKARTERIVAAIDPLTSDSVEQHLALAKGTEAAQYQQTGDYVFLYRDRREFGKQAFGMEMRRAHGYTFDEWDRAEILARDPAISENYQFAARFKDHGWITAPGKYVAALARHFVAAGGRFLQGEVVDIGNGSVTLAGGKVLTADRVVLTTGVWSKPLGEKLGHRVNLESERGYHLSLFGPNHAPPFPYMVADGKFVATPMLDGFRCAGIVEFGGLKAPASRAPLKLLRKRIRRVYPGLTWQSEEVWLGHRPSTPDSLPLLGAALKAPKVIFAFGSQHIGLTIGPRLGRMVCDMVLDHQPNLDMRPYAPDRFD